MFAIELFSFRYVLTTLDQLVAEDYNLIYFHGATPKNCIPRFSWVKNCYQMIDRRLRKNLKRLYLVHPTIWLKAAVLMCRPFIRLSFVLILPHTLILLYFIVNNPVPNSAARLCTSLIWRRYRRCYQWIMSVSPIESSSKFVWNHLVIIIQPKRTCSSWKLYFSKVRPAERKFKQWIIQGIKPLGLCLPLFIFIFFFCFLFHLGSVQLVCLFLVVPLPVSMRSRVAWVFFLNFTPFRFFSAIFFLLSKFPLFFPLISVDELP